MEAQIGEEGLRVTLWKELVSHYTEPHRAYHTLEHLAYMFRKADAHGDAIEDWPAFTFAIFYHDVIYDPKRKDNEAQSADFAQERLKSLGIAEATLARVHQYILATKGHETYPDADTNLLLDIDLGVLGESREHYAEYTRQIRHEYQMYPMVLYRQGRKKVLQHFIAMDRIYKTTAFYASHETQARNNLRWELEML